MGLQLDGRKGRVTMFDIENGIREECSDCPVALALETFFEDFYKPHNWKARLDFYVEVDLDRVEVNRNGEHLYIIGVEESIRDWIIDFDHGFPVNPINFEIYKRERDDLDFWITVQN